LTVFITTARTISLVSLCFSFLLPNLAILLFCILPSAFKIGICQIVQDDFVIQIKQFMDKTLELVPPVSEQVVPRISLQVVPLLN
jgi:hypothetical protein